MEGCRSDSGRNLTSALDGLPRYARSRVRSTICGGLGGLLLASSGRCNVMLLRDLLRNARSGFRPFVSAG